ncbi:hypothetical protein BT96DRAFT_952203, partial [Gymnopus androsaceus JB14]
MEGNEQLVRHITIQENEIPDTLLNEEVIKKEILGVTFHPASEYYSEGSFTLQKEILGIVDTGTTLILLGTAMFNQYISYMGGKYDLYPSMQHSMKSPKLWSSISVERIIDFITGYIFLERFNSVFDSTPGHNR